MARYRSSHKYVVPAALGAAALGTLYFLTRPPAAATQQAKALNANAIAGRLPFSRVGMADPYGTFQQSCSDAPSAATPLPAVASTSFTTMAPVSQLQDGVQFAATDNNGQETTFRANAWPDVPRGIIDATNLATGVTYNVALLNLS